MDGRTGEHALQVKGDEHQVSLDELFRRLKSSDSGLKEDEAVRRLAEYGANVLEEIGKESLLNKYLKQFWNFFSILLTVGSMLAFIAEWLSPGQGNIYIGIALLVVVILNSTFTFIQEYQAEKIMASFRQLIPLKQKSSEW
jgi:sodium/potassium-transporting ATPase subunit alpha